MVEAKSRISPVLNLIDESLDNKLSGAYHLSLLAGLDSFSCCVLDSKRNKYLALCNWTFQGVYNWQSFTESLASIVKETPLLQHGYKSVSAAVVNNKSTLVPDALFENGKEETYLRFNHTLEEEDAVKTDRLKNIEARNIYALPKALERSLGSHFPNVRFMHHSTSFLESVLLQYKNLDQPKVAVHVQMSHFEVAVVEGKKLRLYNSFAHQTSEDFIYYLLFVCEQLKLNPEKLDLLLLGEIERNSAIYSILHKYVRNISFGERSDSFEYSYKLTDLPKHFYYNLFNQYLCV
jgi:hypothetical protein